MKLRLLLVNVFFSFTVAALSAQDSIPKAIEEREYSFLFVDSPARLSTMKQFNENYLSAYRMGVRELNSILPAKYSFMIQAGLAGLFFVPLTHEEGHRSVLTNEGIGSISQPYLNKDMTAYVKGVTDAQLKNLRDTELPTYIRLHTAGLESDYALLLRSASLMNWQKEMKKVLLAEYFIRKLSLVSYYGMGLLKTNAGIKEEANELDRDIVGHDIYGAIRHLHRPEMPFYRYTNYEDLTSEEKRFVKRVGFRALFNLADPLLWGRTRFHFKGYYLNLSGGYGMAPFGDYLDQHIWLNKNTLKMHFYLREFESRNTWYPAFGMDVVDLNLFEKISSNMTLHGWNQPDKLKFNASSGFFGGAIDLLIKYKFLKNGDKTIRALSANIGIVAKTEGFLIEEAALGNHVGLRFGMSIWIK